MNVALRALGPVALVAGVGLLVESLLTGGARLYLFLVIPVITGTSALFALAVGLIVVGVFFLPFLFVGDEEPNAVPAPLPTSPIHATEGDGAAGGVVFVGPVPIFFGGWRKNPPVAYRWAFVLGLVLVVVAFLVLWGFAAL